PRAGDRPASDPHRRPRLAHDAARAAAGGDGDHPPLLRPPGPQGSVRPRADGLPAGAGSGLRLLNLPARLTLAGAPTLLLLSPVAARADDRSYALAVEQAHSLVKEGLGGRPDAAAKARDVLLAGTGQTQPEILSDPDQNPPNYADADKRLGAVAAALGRPGDVDNPAQARSTL